MALKNPILSNPIAVDIPKLNEILDALSKANPTDVDGISTGAMRLYEVSSGKWQWQVYNGTSWAPVPFLQHNVDQLDGYHAAITPAANTVAVRNASGLLEDSIAGNAATASSAATLSQTLPVNKGGTGATTSEQARTNLGVPPTSHASTATRYGAGNATQYGHLKLSDATDSASGVSGGVAATPAAAKAAKDAADAAMTKASTLATASTPGIVKPGTGMTVDAAGALNVTLNNTVTSTSTTQAATANAVKTAYDKALEASNKSGLPLGYIYLWPFSTPPDGSIQINGSAYSRELYSDLWVLIQAKGWYKPESEWQQIASANGGYCPWYSDGDGSTTFRTPKFAPYQKLALASGDAGKYYEAGLPDHTHTRGTMNITGKTQPFYTYGSGGEGAFSYVNLSGGGVTSGSSGNTGCTQAIFNASRSWTGSTSPASEANPIYGNSTTVQPESHDWIVCVVAFGKATNVGSVDVANVMSAVGQVQANPNLQGTAHVVETWKSGNGSSWYRKWSDGWIEQGGPMSSNENVTFHVAFSNTNYYVDVTWNGGKREFFFPFDWRITKSSNTYFTTTATANAQNIRGLCWYACGY